MRLKDALIRAAMVAAILLFHYADASAETLAVSKDYAKQRVRIINRLKIPRWYHEGLFFDGNDIWVANGEEGNTWIVDKQSGGVKKEIKPVGDFTEGITRRSDGAMFVTEWYEKKIYGVKIADDAMVPVREKSFAPAHPAGVAWAEGRLFVVIWTRGIGTRFDLVELDGELNEVKRIEIKKIQEPSQLAWDGKSLWMTSWYSRTVYKVDINTWQITGSFFSPVSLATGIAWDGKYLWLTGTYGDLYKLELVEKKEIRMAEKIKLTSGAFKEGETIPKRYSGLGENLSPPLSWSDIPAGTKSIALLCDDPDAPRGDWVHWIITNIPADSKGLSEGVPNVKVLADGSVQSVNDSLTTGYDGPCPPSGTHRYFFKVYALDKVLGPKDAVNKKAFLKSIEGHILAEGCLMGRYKR